ncbi:MAG: transposase [Bdellovibrionales bacterium]|nr:transposase [Bdellovibrionales bacterium]
MTEKLRGYSGPVVTDGLETYNGVLAEAKIPHAYCWAHARREFFKIESHDPSVTPILDQIDKLFEIERRAKDFSELKALRGKESASYSRFEANSPRGIPKFPRWLAEAKGDSIYQQKMARV